MPLGEDVARIEMLLPELVVPVLLADGGVSEVGDLLGASALTAPHRLDAREGDVAGGIDVPRRLFARQHLQCIFHGRMPRLLPERCCTRPVNCGRIANGRQSKYQICVVRVTHVPFGFGFGNARKIYIWQIFAHRLAAAA